MSGTGPSVQTSALPWPASCTCRRDECSCGAVAEAGAAARQIVTRYFALHRNAVFQYLLNTRCPNRMEAEDVAQEAFLRLYRYLLSGRRLDDDGTLRWVFVVARNLAISRLRRQRCERILFTSLSSELARNLAETLPDTGPTTDDELHERQRRAELMRALQSLTKIERECLHLRAEGLSLHAIGEIVGMRLWGVSRILKRVMRRLQHELHERA